MSINERYQYLLRMQKRHREAPRQDRKALLGEPVAYTEMRRESVIRRLNGSPVDCQVVPFLVDENTWTLSRRSPLSRSFSQCR